MLKYKIEIEVEEGNVTVNLSEPADLETIISVMVNGIVTTLESMESHVVLNTKSTATREEVKSSLHYMAVLLFSQAMYLYDPKSKDYDSN